MKEAVLIKSFSNGIALHLDAEMSFEDLLQEIAYKFSEARAFFGKASMALSIEERQVTGAEEIRILETIRQNSDFNIICIVGKDEATNKNFIRALAHMEKKLSGGEDGPDIPGSTGNGDHYYHTGGCLSWKCRNQCQKHHYPGGPLRGSLCGRKRTGRCLRSSA